MIDSIGKFQVLGELGQGAHSKILHVRRAADSRAYALKVVSLDEPEDVKYLEQAQLELRVAAMLDHPNLIKVYCLEQLRDWLFRVKKAHLLIEFVNGKTLDQVPRLTVPRLVNVFAKIAAGLVHMHRRGVCHADLKPNNIMLGRNGDVKIIDYGLAWIKGEPKGRLQGTPEYMAPEQAKNNMVNERTDIFNFGATMYRLVTWRLPPPTIAEGDGIQMDGKSWQKALKPVKDLSPTAPPELAALIHKCLEYKAVNRPERMSEVQGALDRLADQLGATDDQMDPLEW